MFVDHLYQSQWMSDETLDKLCPKIKGQQFEATHDITNFHKEFIQLSRDEQKALMPTLTKYCNILDEILRGKGYLRIGEKSNLKDTDKEYICDKIKIAQRFTLTSDFTENSLQKLATNETIVKAKACVKLPHNPMFVEWKIEHNRLHDFRIGFLLWQEDESPALECVFFDGLPGSYQFNQFRFYPAEIRLDEEENISVQIETVNREKLCSQWTSKDIDKNFYEICTPHVIDFLIRINSEKITDITKCENLDKINHKREKNGKLPLFDYHIVDLNHQIKRDIKEMDRLEKETDQHIRLHWRRGHFKCRQTGIFWWNPHLAGREELGKIEKHYAA